jgi:hypothetical protein
MKQFQGCPPKVMPTRMSKAIAATVKTLKTIIAIPQTEQLIFVSL